MRNLRSLLLTSDVAVLLVKLLADPSPEVQVRVTKHVVYKKAGGMKARSVPVLLMTSNPVLVRTSYPL